MNFMFNDCAKSTETLIANKQGSDELEIITRDEGRGAISDEGRGIITSDEGRGAISKNGPIKPPIVF